MTSISTTQEATGDDPLKRLNILLMSGVLQMLGVAAALRVSMEDLALICLRKKELGDREPLVRQMLEDYTIAMNDVNMRWRAAQSIDDSERDTIPY